jgi:hypothetical protein
MAADQLGTTIDPQAAQANSNKISGAASNERTNDCDLNGRERAFFFLRS